MERVIKKLEYTVEQEKKQILIFASMFFVVAAFVIYRLQQVHFEGLQRSDKLLTIELEGLDRAEKLIEIQKETLEAADKLRVIEELVKDVKKIVSVEK